MELNIRITKKNGDDAVASNFLKGGESNGVQLTFAVTYQTQPNLFEN